MRYSESKKTLIFNLNYKNISVLKYLTHPVYVCVYIKTKCCKAQIHDRKTRNIRQHFPSTSIIQQLAKTQQQSNQPQRW